MTETNPTLLPHEQSLCNPSESRTSGFNCIRPNLPHRLPVPLRFFARQRDMSCSMEPLRCDVEAFRLRVLDVRVNGVIWDDMIRIRVEVETRYS